MWLKDRSEVGKSYKATGFRAYKPVELFEMQATKTDVQRRVDGVSLAKQGKGKKPFHPQSRVAESIWFTPAVPKPPDLLGYWITVLQKNYQN